MPSDRSFSDAFELLNRFLYSVAAIAVVCDVRYGEIVGLTEGVYGPPDAERVLERTSLRIHGVVLTRQPSPASQPGEGRREVSHDAFVCVISVHIDEVEVTLTKLHEASRRGPCCCHFCFSILLNSSRNLSNFGHVTLLRPNNNADVTLSSTHL
jgi:hypothetical protein